MRDFQLPGRSPVYSTRGMAATSHPLATEAAVAVLRENGTAAEAMVAAGAVLAVVEPHMTGVGGDAFAILAEPDGTMVGLNGAGRSARALDEGTLVARHVGEHGLDHLPLYSPHAVTVPGAVALWERLAATGSMGLDRLLAPAIRLARDGFPVAPRVARDWRVHEPIEGWAGDGWRLHYARNGAAPGAGDVWRLPALAQTLEAIARDGAAGFYGGAAGEELAALLARVADAVDLPDGTIDGDDLLAHETATVEPVVGSFGAVRVAELPPSNQGVTALVLLGLLERLGHAALDPASPERAHLMIEASRLAYAGRDAHLADIDAMATTPDALLDPARLDALAGTIRLDRAGSIHPVPDPGSDTVYACAVDRNGRSCSFINSLFHAFGSGLVTERTGVVLQNRGCGFALERGHPNALAPNKRPLHTLIPGMLADEIGCLGPFGVMGGQYQAHGHAQVVSLMVDHGYDPQSALDAPRVFHEGERVIAERGVPDATVEALRSRGHRVERATDPIGGGQIIRIDRARGALVGGSDPRKDGLALGLA